MQYREVNKAQVNNPRLQNAYQCVRKLFFPRWDRKKQWKVEYMPQFKRWHEKDIAEDIKREGLEGEFVPKKINIGAICQSFRQCILVYNIPRSNVDLYEMLIHEICHVNAPGHREEWALNMNEVYYKAYEMDMKDLADMIKSDIFMSTYNLP